MKRRLLAKALHFIGRHHRWTPVRVQRWLWHVENRYIWERVEIKVKDPELVIIGGAPDELEN